MSGFTSRSAEDLADVSALAAILHQSRIEPEFTMQAVRHETGIPADTLYAWERRYRFPSPGRTATGQRRYSERDIVSIRWLREQTEQGHSISDALALLRRALGSTPAPSSQESPPARPLPGIGESAIVDALLAGDLGAAQASWDRMAIATSPDGLLQDVIMPAWLEVTQGSRDPLARERALAFLLRKVTVLLDHSSPDTGGHDVTILRSGQVESTVPAHALACALSRAGFRIALPVLDASRATTLALVSRLPAPTTVILAGPDPDGDVLESYRVMNPDSPCFRWWLGDRGADEGENWLPPSLREAADALWDRV